MIEVTEAAADRIKSLLEKKGRLDTHGLRMKVIGGGCSGLQYNLTFEDKISEDDNEIIGSGVKIIVDDKSALYLSGTTLDFIDTLMDSGFKVDNPNAANTCGCGQSFGT